MEGLATTFENFKKSLNDIFNKIGDIFTAIGKIAGNVVSGIGEFFSTLWEHLLNIISYINPFSDNFLGKKIVDLIGDLLQNLFVPKKDHFGELRNTFNEKFGFIEQVKELITHLFSFNYTQTVSAEGSSSEDFIDISGNYPGFKITYYGYTFSIIDFSVLDKFRGYLHAIIVAVLWISFLFRVFKRIPGIIYAYDTSDVK